MEGYGLREGRGVDKSRCEVSRGSKRLRGRKWAKVNCIHGFAGSTSLLRNRKCKWLNRYVVGWVGLQETKLRSIDGKVGKQIYGRDDWGFAFSTLVVTVGGILCC